MLRSQEQVTEVEHVVTVVDAQHDSAQMASRKAPGKGCTPKGKPGGNNRRATRDWHSSETPSPFECCPSSVFQQRHEAPTEGETHDEKTQTSRNTTKAKREEESKEGRHNGKTLYHDPR